ncbi:C-type lectin domain family 4 member E-like isoform X2 [Motacilla alba alba]|uniref:C-type lectin domain family 4 member E-like isoform X2 n=1 Tax=Motacilla alba alba TaxID=1094192 RepID=UPI0018D5411B|nr:C-type lectin domain family 4 member E-like isoform X2 [Motacilla alba alba]
MNGQGRVSPGSAAPAEERGCSWLNIWVFLIFALPIKAAFVTIGLVALLDGSSGHYKILLQNSTEWRCVPSSSAEKVDGWTCCPKGWKRFQGSCYFLSRDTMSWSESAQNCSGMGSQLVVISSKAEQEFLFNLAKEKATRMYETKFYIGLAAYKNGKWQWVDQTPYENTATFWKPGEPNLLFAEKCAAIHVKGNTDPNTYSNWNNVLCITSCYRICEQAVKLL